MNGRIFRIGIAMLFAAGPFWGCSRADSDLQNDQVNASQGIVIPDETPEWREAPEHRTEDVEVIQGNGPAPSTLKSPQEQGETELAGIQGVDALPPPADLVPIPESTEVEAFQPPPAAETAPDNESQAPPLNDVEPEAELITVFIIAKGFRGDEIRGFREALQTETSCEIEETEAETPGTVQYSARTSLGIQVLADRIVNLKEVPVEITRIEPEARRIWAKVTTPIYER